MITRFISSNRMLSVMFIVVFMIFATPTPIAESNINETARTTVQQGMEFYSTNTTVRKQTSTSETLRVLAYLATLHAVLHSLIPMVRRVLTEAHISFHPQIARRLTRMLLSPLKFSSLYV
ncbi:hypothetical protein ACFQ88_30445 [Paenibacillus sp. NPDC056579]|uniref:hypothetical protein n=1 Tax=unclassified Paenibacillus TaxID=185978 RepID=UPI001EF969D9|nr:hypothetical protein [Paenibacillus sp. H1-7]ULL15355.1 hypothetical protein DVH26_13455 [Paenibacillus sp. H1-7]